MSEEVFVDLRDSQKIGIVKPVGEAIMFQHQKPEEIKVMIWGYELCNGAEWQDFLDIVNKLGREKSDLEAKLAETEKELEIVCVEGKDKVRENIELKQQLAEKDKAITAYEKIVEQKDEELGFANRDKTCIVKQLNDPNAYVSLEDYKRIEQQLAEKGKRSRNAIDDLKNKLNKTREELEIANNQILFDNTEFEKLNKQLAEKEKSFDWIYSKWQKCVKNQTKSKTEFAIQQLQRVKDYFVKEPEDDKGTWQVIKHAVDVAEYINQIIKELEGKTNEQN